MSTDKSRTTQPHQFVERFDQKLQQHQKLRNSNILKIDELQQKSLRADRTALELRSMLEKSKQQAEYYKRQYELLRDEKTETPGQQVAISMEREVRRLNAMLEQAALENRRLTEQLGEQPREIEILREEVRSLNDSIEKVSQHSSRPQALHQLYALRHLRRKAENEQLRAHLLQRTKGDAVIEKRIRVLEAENVQLRRWVKEGKNMYEAGTPKRESKNTNSMKELFIDKMEESADIESSKEDLIEELRSQNAMLKRHLQQTNHRFEEQIEKFNSYIEKLPKTKTTEDRSKLSTMFKSMSLYFYDFNKQRQKYQQKITDLLRQIVRLKNLSTTATRNLALVTTQAQISQQSGLCHHNFL